jgi:hypothetical protein
MSRSGRTRKDSSERHLRETKVNSQGSVWLTRKHFSYPEGIHQLIVLEFDRSCVAPSITEREQEMEHIRSFADLRFRYFVLNWPYNVIKATGDESTQRTNPGLITYITLETVEHFELLTAAELVPRCRIGVVWVG